MSSKDDIEFESEQLMLSDDSTHVISIQDESLLLESENSGISASSVLKGSNFLALSSVFSLLSPFVPCTVYLPLYDHTKRWSVPRSASKTASFHFVVKEGSFETASALLVLAKSVH